MSDPTEQELIPLRIELPPYLVAKLERIAEKSEQRPEAVASLLIWQALHESEPD